MREQESERGRGRERGGQKIWSGLCVDSREPDVGLELTNCEIMTWAEVSRLHSIPNVNKSFDLTFSKTHSFLFVLLISFTWSFWKTPARGVHPTRCYRWSLFTYSLQCVRVVFPTPRQQFWMVASYRFKPVDPLLTCQKSEDPYLREVLLLFQQLLPGPWWKESQASPDTY